MPPSSQTVKEYCSLIARSKLKSPDEVKDAYRRWQETSKSNPDAEAEPFRKYLVSRKVLTEYQSHLLLRGHSEGFFLDQYTILDLIGKGRMAGVYKAMHASGQLVALKVLPPSKAKQAMILSRFQREGRLLTKLDHANVVRAFQIGEANGKHFIVMEYLEGEPLDEILNRRKRLLPSEAVRLIHQTLLGLQHVFEKGMVHRDLKPANIILVPAPEPGPGETTLNSVVKILDIGLGRSTFDEDSKEPDSDPQLTTEGTLLGTPEYLAPEQARSAHDVDIRADIYSLGCVLYHLLTGQSPFPPVPGEGVLQQIVKHVTETPRPLSDFLPQVPEGLQQVMNWMMAKEPNQRYPTPARAAQAMQMFLLQTPEISPTTAPLPGFVQYLQTTGPAETTRPTGPAPVPPPAPGTAIPTGRLEPDSRRKSAERKKDGSASRPKLPALAAPEVAPPTADDGEYDVEIVTVAPPEFMPPPTSAPPAPKTKDPDEPRGLLDLDRRDYIMASIGGGIVLSAILLGYGVSRLLRGPTPVPTTEQSTPTEQTERPKRKIEEKKVELKVEEPKEPKTEEMKKDDTKKDDTKKDDATTDPTKGDTKKDDAKKDDAKKDDAKTEPKKDDAKKDDAKKDDPKVDPKKDDPKADPKKVDPKADLKKDDPKKPDDKKDSKSITTARKDEITK